jgi:hypothetical protein
VSTDETQAQFQPQGELMATSMVANRFLSLYQSQNQLLDQGVFQAELKVVPPIRLRDSAGSKEWLGEILHLKADLARVNCLLKVARRRKLHLMAATFRHHRLVHRLLDHPGRMRYSLSR